MIDKLFRAWWLESRNLGDSQVRPLMKKSLDFPHSSDHMADALIIANSVVLKAFWRVGQLGRTHLIPPVSACVSSSALARRKRLC